MGCVDNSRFRAESIRTLALISSLLLLLPQTIINKFCINLLFRLFRTTAKARTAAACHKWNKSQAEKQRKHVKLAGHEDNNGDLCRQARQLKRLQGEPIWTRLVNQIRPRNGTMAAKNKKNKNLIWSQTKYPCGIWLKKTFVFKIGTWKLKHVALATRSLKQLYALFNEEKTNEWYNIFICDIWSAHKYSENKF